MTKASYSAKKTSKEITEHFSKMGDAAEGLLAPFGEVGEKLGQMFGGLGNTFGSVTKGFQGMAGGASEAAVAIGGVVAAVAALGVVGGGIAAFAANAANEFFEMSEKTGVSVETLTRFSYAASLSGISSESLAKGLEKMNKSAFAAAVAPEGAKNAYTRLGVSVTDVHGKLRSTQDILLDVADKFSHMEKGVARGALAQQLFGKAGADMLPFLVRGKAGIKDLSDEADKLGVTLDEKTAAGSHAFEETLKRMQGALKGASNAVLIELLPAIQGFASFMFDELKDPSSPFRIIGGTILDVVVPAFKVLAGAIGVIVTAVNYMTTILSHGLTFFTTLIIGISDSLSKLGQRDFRGAADALKESFTRGLGEFSKGVSDDVDKANNKLSKLMGKLIFGADDSDQSKHAEGSDGDGTDTKKADKRNLVNDRITKIAAEVAKNAELARSITDVKGETIALTAAAEAQQIIADLNIQGAQKGVTVNEQQATAISKLTLMVNAFKEALNVNKQLETSIQKTEQTTQSAQLMAAAYLEGADAVERAKEQIELLPLKKQVSDLQGVYNQLAETSGGFGDLTYILKKMGPEGKVLAEQFKSLGVENLATLRGALADALDKLGELQEKKPLEVQAKTAEQANKKIGELKTTTEAHIRALQDENVAILAGGKALGDYKIAQELEKLFPKEIDKQTQAYKDLKSELEQVSAEEQTRAQNQSRQALDKSVQAHIRALQDENAAILEGGTALKNFNTYKQLEKDYPTVTDKETDAYKTQLKSLDDLNQLELQNAADRKVNALLKFNDLQTELDYLKKLLDSGKLNADQTIAVDAVIHEDMLKQAQDYDNLLLKSNQMGDGFKAFFNEFATQGKTAAQQVYDVMNTTFTGIQDNLSKFFTAQKTNWKGLGKSIEDSLAKTLTGDAMKAVTKSALGFLGLGGLAGGKADGSTTNPFSVKIVSGGAAGGAAGAGGGLGSFLKGLPGIGSFFSGAGGGSSTAPDGSQFNPFYVMNADPTANSLPLGNLPSSFGSLLSGGSSSGGGGFGGILGLLSGIIPFLADGGDTQPNRAYVVGEKRPELFVPRSAGTIVPSVPGAGTSVHQTTVHAHFHGVSDADSFKKSQTQISNTLGGAVARAQSRLGR
jgi:hypothetical protein